MSLNDFAVLAKLGEGAYSTVHKVKRISDGQIYALKKVRMKALKEKEKQNALNEVRLLASIDSEHIIAYKESFYDEATNTLCIVIEYADGGDLEKVIQEKKKLLEWIPEATLWKLLQEVATGLGELHRKNIIHRDVKPANIFIRGGHFKIADLNVSKLLKMDFASTQTGTPYYASPEVWKDNPYEMKSDIWSLGCILYEACALKPPFTATSMEGLYKKVIKGSFPRIPTVYSPQLERVITSCLQVEPSKRPTCEELLRDLRLPTNEEKSAINMLSTIRIPKNAQSWRQGLPKAKYDTDRDPEKKLVLGARVSYVSQHKLKQIVRQKLEEAQYERQNRSISEASNPVSLHSRHSHQHEMSVPQSLSIKAKRGELEMLPRIKVHSQPMEIISEDRRRSDQVRPAWWG